MIKIELRRCTWLTRLDCDECDEKIVDQEEYIYIESSHIIEDGIYLHKTCTTQIINKLKGYGNKTGD